VFSHEGPDRSARKNGILAGYLALTAGFVNAAGFVLIGSFTSHVTGSIGRLGNDIAARDGGAALFASLLVVTFFLGAFAASMIVEAQFNRVAKGYGFALLLEGALLLSFLFIERIVQATHARELDAEASILCFAMGMQNSLVTRISGAVIRTTHLTGIVTDLGIEAARWYRWHRSRLVRIPTIVKSRDAGRPVLVRTVLLGTILVSFAVGGIAGAVVTAHHSRWAMVLPALLLFAASGYAFASKSRGPRPPMESVS
jgi:uncharacterized membrane protein YoaK (UPF0700 family)